MDPFYSAEKWLNVYRHFRIGGRQQAKRYLDEFEHNHSHVFSFEPPVLYLWWGRNDLALHQELASCDLTVCYLFPWCFSTKEIPAIAFHVEQIKRRYPRHKIIFLCNEEYAVSELRLANLSAEFVNQNAFINENYFRPRPDIKRTHDAIYSASLAPYKRHYLAEKVSSLIMLSYTYAGSSKDQYGDDVRHRLAHAYWAKDSLSDSQKLPVENLVDFYAQAHVGLCLSEIEGSMFVSMEYLLCGLPIVSTKSVGGRDSFWDDRYVIVCDDSPEVVAQSVQELKNRCISSDDIRRWTLEKVEMHRHRLRLLLHQLGVHLDCPWPPGSHGISSFVNIRKLGKRLRRAN
jgi:glycosyltransferase involved in cell wall biosynthesis